MQVAGMLFMSEPLLEYLGKLSGDWQPLINYSLVNLYHQKKGMSIQRDLSDKSTIPGSSY